VGLIPDEVIGFFSSPNFSSCTVPLGSTQPLTDMSTRNIPEGKGQSAHKADNLTAASEPIIYVGISTSHKRMALLSLL
jgi:hypothetical protein